MHLLHSAHVVTAIASVVIMVLAADVAQVAADVAQVAADVALEVLVDVVLEVLEDVGPVVVAVDLEVPVALERNHKKVGELHQKPKSLSHFI